MNDIGEILKQSREQSGFTISDISQKTNIPQHLLRSLENNEYEEFPGKFYYLIFLKNYLKTIRVDVPDFLKTYKKELDLVKIKEDQQKILFSKLKYSRFKKKSVTFLLLVFILLLILLLGYIYLQNKNKTSGPSAENNQDKQAKPITLNQPWQRLTSGIDLPD